MEIVELKAERAVMSLKVIQVYFYVPVLDESFQMRSKIPDDCNRYLHVYD